MRALLTTHILTALVLVNESFAFRTLIKKHKSTTKNKLNSFSHVFGVFGKEGERFSFGGLFLFPLSHDGARGGTMMRQTASKAKLGATLALDLITNKINTKQ